MVGLLPGVNGPDELRGISKCRIRRIDFDHGEDGGQGDSGELVPELLFQDVPDHAFGLSAQHIEGIRLNFGVRRGLERQQTYLWSIAMGKDQFVLAGNCG